MLACAPNVVRGIGISEDIGPLEQALDRIERRIVQQITRLLVSFLLVLL